MHTEEEVEVIAEPLMMAPAKKVRVSSILSSDVLMNNNMVDNFNAGSEHEDVDDDESSADSGSNDVDHDDDDDRDEEEEDDDDDDGPPSVIATYTSGSPLEASSNHYLNEAIGSDDDSGTLIDSIERDELNDDSSIESSVDATELELEDQEEEEEEEEEETGNLRGGNDRVEVAIGTLGEGLIHLRAEGSAAPGVVLMPSPRHVRFSPAEKVKSFINTLGTTIRNAFEIPEASNDRPSLSASPSASSTTTLLPVLKAFLYVALIPMCSYVLREATFVTRDVSMDLRERGIVESLALLHIMVGLNVLFSISIMVCFVAILLKPSRLSRFIASLDTATTSSTTTATTITSQLPPPKSSS